MKLLTAEARLAETRGVKLAVLGRPGTGKTHLLHSLTPEMRASTLFLDAEAGDLCVADLEVASVRPETWPDFRDIACVLGGPNAALASSSPYSAAHHEHAMAKPELAELVKFKTLFVDSLSEASRRCRLWAEQQPEARSGRGREDLRAVYGLVAREMIGWLMQLQRMRERNVIFVAVLEKSVDDFNVATWRPQIEGQRTAAVLPAIVDEVLTLEFLDFGDRQPVRAFVCTEPNAWHFPAKDRSGRLEPIEEPNLAKLLLKLTPPRAQGG